MIIKSLAGSISPSWTWTDSNETVSCSRPWISSFDLNELCKPWLLDIIQRVIDVTGELLIVFFMNPNNKFCLNRVSFCLRRHVCEYSGSGEVSERLSEVRKFYTFSCPSQHAATKQWIFSFLSNDFLTKQKHSLEGRPVNLSTPPDPDVEQRPQVNSHHGRLLRHL